MDAIWMDPGEMRATAGFVAERVLRIQETVTGTRTACTCEVPRSLIGWLDAELVAIATQALQVAVSYLTEAADLALRANQIQADQSLVAAQAGLLPPSVGLPTVAGTPLGGGFLLSGTTAELTSPSATGAPLGGGFVLDATELDPRGGGFVLHSGTSFTPSMSGFIGSGPAGSLLDDPVNDSLRTMLMFPTGSGATYDDGAIVDERGARGSSLAAMWEDPLTGELDN